MFGNGIFASNEKRVAARLVELESWYRESEGAKESLEKNANGKPNFNAELMRIALSGGGVVA